MSLKIGSRVKLTQNIWDDGEDHHPPGWLAMKDEVLIVRSIGQTCISISHENILDNSFIAYSNEYEIQE